jgi:hypothetical protein
MKSRFVVIPENEKGCGGNLMLSGARKGPEEGMKGRGEKEKWLMGYGYGLRKGRGAAQI